MNDVITRQATVEEIARDIVVAIINKSSNFSPHRISQNNSRRQIEALTEAYKAVHAVVEECAAK